MVKVNDKVFNGTGKKSNKRRVKMSNFEYITWTQEAITSAKRERDLEE